MATYVRESRVEERPRGGRNNTKVDDEMPAGLNEIVNENCLMTLNQNNQELRRRQAAKPQVHDRTIARALDGMLIRCKIARPLPAERNRPDVIEKRVEYANWFMANGVLNHCVFIDECGYNIWTATTHGRARVGERAYRQVCGQRGQNVTVTMAISPLDGLVYHSVQIGGMNAQRFGEFLVQTRQQLDPDQLVFFIYDRANPGANTQLKMLPPYSPFLNIVEQAISMLFSLK